MTMYMTCAYQACEVKIYFAQNWHLLQAETALFVINIDSCHWLLMVVVFIKFILST